MQITIVGAGAIGGTMCYPSGEGAGTQAAGQYGLLATKLANEGGIVRVNRQTGEISVCYVLNNGVVCTPPGR